MASSKTVSPEAKEYFGKLLQEYAVYSDKRENVIHLDEAIQIDEDDEFAEFTFEA